MNQRAFSQVGQDATVISIFRGKKGGFFVDLASNDAITLSNSLLLEQRYNWDGVCIEANPTYLPGYKYRKCHLLQAAVGAVDNEEAKFAFRGSMGGVVKSEFDNKDINSSGLETLLTVSLGTLFQDIMLPPVIDYLSLDIEGAEAWAFSTFPWGKHKFLVLTVERPKPEIVRTFKQQGYKYMCSHGDFGDELWFHDSLRVTVPNGDDIFKRYSKSEPNRTISWGPHSCPPAEQF